VCISWTINCLQYWCPVQPWRRDEPSRWWMWASREWLRASLSICPDVLEDEAKLFYCFFLDTYAKFVSLLTVLGTNSSSEITVNVPVRRPPLLRTDTYCRRQSGTQFLHIAVSDADKCADIYLMIFVHSVRLSDVLQCMRT